MDLLRTFFESFIPLFVAIDAFGLVPLFLSVTGGMTEERRRRVTFEAVVAATIIAVSFMFLGRAIFDFLRITEDDFKIAGGIILLVLAILDLLSAGKPAVIEEQTVGIVPLAMPLIIGPATMTTILVLSARSYAMTLACLAVNLAILLAVMLLAGRIARLVGINSLRAFSKLVMVLLAAIGVYYIREGVMAAVKAAR
jgi:multiple antibiotic resistance protein